MQEWEGKRKVGWQRSSLVNKDKGSQDKAVWQDAGSSAKPGRLQQSASLGNQQGPGNEISASQKVVCSG